MEYLLLVLGLILGVLAVVFLVMFAIVKTTNQIEEVYGLGGDTMGGGSQDEN